MNIVGITNGPIYETVLEASSPAALWFASSFFSEYTRRLCNAICVKIPDARILSPYYDDRVNLKDGVGKFHDRIIFKSNETQQDLEKKLKDIISNVKNSMIKLFLTPDSGKDTSGMKDNGFTEEEISNSNKYLSEYLYSEFVIRDDAGEESNAVLAISDSLDAIELMRDFPQTDSSNPFRKLFAGKGDNDRNAYIKNSALLAKVTTSPNPLLKKNGNIISIEDIAGGQAHSEAVRNNTEKLKKHYYYAVVSADGDAMGKYLQKLDDDHVGYFSRCCFDYVAETAQKIKNFGGMTIYAGGDDLLFLAPIESTDGKKSIFHLCKEISNLFVEKLSNDEHLNSDKELQGIPKPTISFGISIQYVKYPLYEALNESQHLLDDVVKGLQETRNSMAVHLQKHSGQSCCLRISNDSVERFEKYLSHDNNDRDSQKESEKAEQDETNVIRQLSVYSNVLEYLDKKAAEPGSEMGRDEYLAAWKNFFDNPDQESFAEYLNDLGGRFYDDFLVPDGKGVHKADIEIPYSYLSCYHENGGAYVQTLISILRLRKFYVEKAGEEEIVR